MHAPVICLSATLPPSAWTRVLEVQLASRRDTPIPGLVVCIPPKCLRAVYENLVGTMMRAPPDTKMLSRAHIRQVWLGLPLEPSVVVAIALPKCCLRLRVDYAPQPRHRHAGYSFGDRPKHEYWSVDAEKEGAPPVPPVADVGYECGTDLRSRMLRFAAAGRT